MEVCADKDIAGLSAAWANIFRCSVMSAAAEKNSGSIGAGKSGQGAGYDDRTDDDAWTKQFRLSCTSKVARGCRRNYFNGHSIYCLSCPWSPNRGKNAEIIISPTPLVQDAVISCFYFHLSHRSATWTHRLPRIPLFLPFDARYTTLAEFFVISLHSQLR